MMDLGERHGSLVYVGDILPDKEGRLIGSFMCDCGTRARKAIGRVATRRTPLHCGCQTERGKSRTHGMRGTPEYSSWQSMKGRCLSPTNKDYPRWGGIGVTVCSEWASSFEAFYSHVGKRPEGTTLDRIDPYRGYEPGNVRWATPREQMHNRKDFVVVSTPLGTMGLADYAKAIGISKGAAHLRLKRGRFKGVARL